MRPVSRRSSTLCGVGTSVPWILLAIVTHAGCRTSNLGTSPDDLANAPALPQIYSFDFSASAAGGIGVGMRTNLAVAFDAKVPSRSYSVRAPGKEFAEAGAYLAMDLAACDDTGGDYDTPADKLPAVDSLKLGTILVETSDNVHQSLVPALCFGYRDIAGVWHFDRRPVAMEFDAQRGVFRSTLSLGGQVGSGIKLIFNYFTEFLYVRRVVVSRASG